MRNEQRYCGKLQRHVWIQNLCWGFRKKKKQLCSGKLVANISSWSFDMAGHAKKCVERYCELAHRTTQQLYKVSTPCIDDHHFKEELKSVGELSKVCPQIGLKCLYLARIGRPDILCSVNKFARSITRWTKACDKRLSRLISYIHHTCEYTQYCHVGNTSTTMQVGIVSGLWLCWRSCRLKIDLKVNFAHIWKSYVCSQKLDVYEANFCFTQFDGIWDYLSWCRSTHGWNSRSWSLGFGFWSVAFFLQPTSKIQRECAGKPAAWQTIKKTN